MEFLPHSDVGRKRPSEVLTTTKRPKQFFLAWVSSSIQDWGGDSGIKVLCYCPAPGSSPILVEEKAIDSETETPTFLSHNSIRQMTVSPRLA